MVRVQRDDDSLGGAANVTCNGGIVAARFGAAESGDDESLAG
jgi:bifunctional ADP-heptose synthase (sugar kinase/adenylyltransferase)